MKQSFFELLSGSENNAGNNNIIDEELMMHYGLILAAGKGKRIGGRIKALLPFLDHTYIEEIIGNMIKAGIEDRVVVLNTDNSERVINAVNLRGTGIVINAEPEKGMLSSIRCVVRTLPSECEGIVLHLVDHPMVKVETYRIIFENARKYPDKIILPSCGPRHGHPTVFPAKHFNEIMTGPEEEGIRFLLKKYPDDIITVNVNDPGIFTDVDTMDQFGYFQ